jgi:methanogenic corrinoid protein MtbC1
MHAWCSYCQRYLGERAPFDVHQLTHGLCPQCDEEGRFHAPISPAVEAIASFFRAVLDPDQALPSPELTISRGLSLGIRPIDLLVGILQPTLEEVGRRWERKELTHEQEAIFTARCLSLIEELERQRPPSSGSKGTLLLMNAHWNRHVLGARVAAYWLAERGYTVELCTPTPPLDELPALIQQRRPDAIGVSLATEWQLPFLQAVVDVVAELPVRPRILVGGAAVRAGCKLVPGVEQLDFTAEEPSP